MNDLEIALCVAWHKEEQIVSFLKAWDLPETTHWLFLQQDKNREGCAKTKNRAIERAMSLNPSHVMVLDDDIRPSVEAPNIDSLREGYRKAFLDQPVELYKAVSNPPSRGTPFFNKTMNMPVAAVMSFWLDVADWSAPAQLIHGARHEMRFYRKPMFQRFFAFSGMACAFKANFWPYFRFDETADRYDDIWMGYRLQKEAWRRGHCINLNGPLVKHVRQSDVFKNLKIEAENMERNETEWMRYA